MPNPKFHGESLEEKEGIQPDFREIPIKQASPEVLEYFKNKRWRGLPIVEKVTEEPKLLAVVPNTYTPGQTMAWPAYYKTVQEGAEAASQSKGFGELAQALPGDLQASPLVKVGPEVKAKLDRAQRLLDRKLATAHLQLVVVDGYRRIDIQKKLFETYCDYLRSQEENKVLSPDELKDLARKMVSESPADLEILRKSPPPHSTGGAIDIILVDKSKIDTSSDHWLDEAMVPFGAKFDEMMDPIHKDERSLTAFYEYRLAEQGELSQEDAQALENRRVIYHALTTVGFTNYHNEFWHYDFGNQFYAAAAGKDTAEYGFAGGISEDGVVENLKDEEEAFAAYAASQGQEEAQRVKHHFGL